VTGWDDAGMDVPVLRGVPGPPDVPGVVQAVRETIAALDCPKTDAAVAALALVTAQTIDAMPPGQKGMMLGQTGPLLLRLLQELEGRAAKRRQRDGPGRSNRVAVLRAAHAQSKAKQGRAG
jgi:hypothetical protein